MNFFISSVALLNFSKLGQPRRFLYFFFSLLCLFSVKLICSRIAKAVRTGLCQPFIMGPTHLFVIHKSWLFRACQNAALAPVPTHLRDNESSGKYRHKMAASVSAACFFVERRIDRPDDVQCKIARKKSQILVTFFSGRLYPAQIHQYISKLIVRSF